MWCQDEARVGQKGSLTRRWHTRGERPRALRDHRFRSAWIFGAVCPERDTGVALIFSRVSTEAMNMMLAEISEVVAEDAHAALVMDGAGWHVANDLHIPDNITILRLPSYSPELNPIERVWQHMRDRFFSHRVFADMDHIFDACCDGWNRLCAETGRIASLTAFPYCAKVNT